MGDVGELLQSAFELSLVAGTVAEQGQDSCHHKHCALSQGCQADRNGSRLIFLLSAFLHQRLTFRHANGHSCALVTVL
jgi:hypothetical protein